MSDNHESPSIEELIERSSLGTPEAKAARESVPLAVAQEVVRRARELSDNHVTTETLELVQRERALARAENCLLDAVRSLREARALFGDARVPLDVIHRVEKMADAVWRDSVTNDEREAK